MKTIMNALTALATVVALSNEAAALGDFAPVNPLVQPQVLRPVIVPAADVSRLTKKPSPPSIDHVGTEDTDKCDRNAGQRELDGIAEAGPQAEPSAFTAVAEARINIAGMAILLRRGPRPVSNTL